MAAMIPIIVNPLNMPSTKCEVLKAKANMMRCIGKSFNKYNKMEQFNWVLIITWVILPALRKPAIANSLLFVARDAR